MSRNQTFDILKGIGILLVIAGHSALMPKSTQHFIYSFHMPLFFLVGGYFHKLHPTTIQSIHKDVRRLIYPYIFTCGIYISYAIISHFIPQWMTLSYYGSIVGSLFGSGCYQDSVIGRQMPMLGAIWFLLALFWCKSIFNYIMTSSIRHKQVTLLLLSISSVVLHPLISLPFSILPGLTAIIFYFIGYKVHEKSSTPYLIPLLFICWFLSLRFSSISIASCKMELYPIDVLGACGGTYFFYIISKGVSKIPYLGTSLAYLGRISLPVLCFHFLWLHLQMGSQFHLTGKCLLFCEFAFPLSMALLCNYINPIHKIFFPTSKPQPFGVV